MHLTKNGYEPYLTYSEALTVPKETVILNRLQSNHVIFLTAETPSKKPIYSNKIKHSPLAEYLRGLKCSLSIYLLSYFETIFLMRSTDQRLLIELSRFRVSTNGAIYLDILTLQYHSRSKKLLRLINKICGEYLIYLSVLIIFVKFFKALYKRPNVEKMKILPAPFSLSFAAMSKHRFSR